MRISDWSSDVCSSDLHTPQFHVDRSRRRWRRIHDPLERMRWRIRRDLAGDMENMRFILEEGEPAEKLVEIAAREECDLIVTGAARQESIERMLWGSTIIRLVRGSPVPVLVRTEEHPSDIQSPRRISY